MGVPIALCILLTSAVCASADPVPADPGGAAPAAATDTVPVASPAAEAVTIDGDVVSSPPVTSALEGVTLTISARNETQTPVAPLTTAISTREYVVGGVFDGSITGSTTPPEGVFEVGYQIGCGIDMSTGGGVFLGISGQGALGSDAVLSGPLGFNLPPIGIFGGGAGVNGLFGVNLKPGIVNTVPVTKKSYKGPAPEIEVSNLRVKVDGCVGESFIRSYATLSRSTAEVEDVVSWFGVTKAV
jgi:hypothetical protein